MAAYDPDPKLKFTFGLWTVGNPGRDPFGLPTREMVSPVEIVNLIVETGAYGVNLHNNNLVPIDATPPERHQIVRDFKKALKQNGLVVPMATTNLFGDPAFKDGAFTSNNAKIRAYAIQKTTRAMDLGAECGAKIYVFWGRREGIESDACKHPVDSIKRFLEAIDFLCDYSIEQKCGYKFAFEAKSNEPRGHIYFAATGSCLALIPTLKHPDMWGVNPEVAHEHMAGLNFVRQIAAVLEAKNLFHIDLNDQEFGRYDQDFRFAGVNLKHAFVLVKPLEDYGCYGPRYFDAHGDRQSDHEDAKEFAEPCMRTYSKCKTKELRRIHFPLSDLENCWNQSTIQLLTRTSAPTISSKKWKGKLKHPRSKDLKANIHTKTRKVGRNQRRPRLPKNGDSSTAIMSESSGISTANEREGLMFGAQAEVGRKGLRITVSAMICGAKLFKSLKTLTRWIFRW